MNAAETNGREGAVRTLIQEVRGLERQLRHLPGSGAGIPPGGGAVLMELLEHGEQTVPQIGRRRGTSRQNIQILVNRLKAEGWVEMAQNPAHRRSELVRLTQKGHEVVEKIVEHEAAFLGKLAAELSAETVMAASDVLKRVRELMVGTAQPEPVKPRAQWSEKPAAAPKPEESVPARVEENPVEEEWPVSLL